MPRNHTTFLVRLVLGLGGSWWTAPEWPRNEVKRE